MKQCKVSLVPSFSAQIQLAKANCYVVHSFEKGDFLENSHILVLFCPIKIILFNLLCVFDLKTELHKLMMAMKLTTVLLNDMRVLLSSRRLISL